MKFYGMELVSGTDIINLTAERGSSYPSINIEDAATNKGRLFFNTSINTLSVWNGASWLTVGGGSASVVSTFNGRNGDVVLQASDLTGLIDGSNLPTASATVKGGVKIGSGLTMTGDVLSAGISGGGDMPSGTRCVFAQASAPTGWTQVTAEQANNRLLRVVNVAGGSGGSGGTGGYGYGGSDDPTVMNKIPGHTHTFSGTAASAGAHTHAYTTMIYDNNIDGVDSTTTHSGDHHNESRQTGSSGAHTHTVSGTTALNSGADTWTPKYLNLIICTKN